MKQLTNIRNDIVRDIDVFERCAEMFFDEYYGALESVSIISYKILMGYSLSVIKEHDKKIFDLILEKSFLFFKCLKAPPVDDAFLFFQFYLFISA